MVQAIPFECTPVQVRVPSEQSPASRHVFRGQKVGPLSAKGTESLKAPPVSSNWPQQVQLPLKPQTNSKQDPVQSQWTHPVETSKQVTVQFQSTRPIEHRMPDPVKVTCSDGFLGERSA